MFPGFEYQMGAAHQQRVERADPADRDVLPFLGEGAAGARQQTANSKGPRDSAA